LYRLVAALAAFAFLASGSSALADGQTQYVTQGGLGALASDGKTRYVAVVGNIGTVIERIRVGDGAVVSWTSLAGFWGIPAPIPTANGGEGLTRDGKKLIIATTGSESTQFAVLGARFLRVLDRFTLDGNFAFDALSPDGSMLYVIQHVDSSDTSRYVVRAYDLKRHALLPGRIADKTQQGWVMAGSAVTRTTSGDGRMIYTMYSRPGGYPFIHALDTMQGIAHCVGLPWHGDQAPLQNARLVLGHNDKALAVNLKGGRTWLTMNTANWRLTHVQQADGSSWRWPLAGAGVVGVALAVGLAFVLLGRRRHPREAAPVPL
jgi:hypothetical protein